MRRWVVLLIIMVATIIVDQTSKQFVVNSLSLGESISPIPALSPLFQITYSENTGAAFGFLPQAGNLLFIIAIVVVAVMFIFYRRMSEDAKLTQIAIGLIGGGALSNAVNRLQHGAVIDFIHYQIPGVISNVSNLADHAIVLGAILVLISSWQTERSPKSVEDTGTQP